MFVESFAAALAEQLLKVRSVPRLKRLVELVVTDSVESENEYQRAARGRVLKVAHFFASAQQQLGTRAAREKRGKPDQDREQ